MKQWIVFAVLGTLSLTAFADSVQTIDGQSLEGLRVAGLPSEVALLSGGVEITIDTAQLATISFSGGIVVAKTTAGSELSGSLATGIQSVFLKTETGEVEIPFDRVAGVAFERKASREDDHSASITLVDGRVFDGDLPRSFPSEISLDSNGIVTTTRLSAITTLTFGETAVLETSSAALSGRLVTAMPETIVMGTDFGSYAIPASQAAEIRISKPQLYQARSVLTPAIGVSGAVEAGFLGADVVSLGVGSFALLQGGKPSWMFDYALTVFRESLLHTSLQFGGITGRVSLGENANVLPTLGLRLLGVPYWSGFVVRTDWLVGAELGVAIDLGKNLWVHIGASSLFGFYWYPQFAGASLRVTVAYYVPIAGEARGAVEEGYDWRW